MRKRFMATAASFCKDPSGALRHLPLQGRLWWAVAQVSPNRGDVGCADRGVTPAGFQSVPQGHLNLFFFLFSIFFIL